MIKGTVIAILFFFSSCPAVGQQGPYRSFIPKGYAILDTATGDLNRDAYPDMVMILKAEGEKDSFNVNRPLLLLGGTPDGGYRLIVRNDSVALCNTCGGVFGDPHQGITIRKGYFSIEHYGGSNYRWTRIITFRYDPALKNFRLHRDAGIAYFIADPDHQEEVIYNKEHYGKMPIANYANE